VFLLAVVCEMAKMIRAAFAWVVFASTHASRIQEHSVLGSTTQTKFGATCEDLQDRFHTRVAAIQESLDGIDDHSELGALAQTRLMMRMHGILRTLRRAQECSWVVENNSDDLDQMRGVVQQLIAGNPCAQAASADLEGPEGIGRAIGILVSDDCEAPEIPPVDGQLMTVDEEQNLEDAVQDGLDELADNSDGSAFIEMDKTQRSQFLRRFLRGIGVFFLLIFFLLACVTGALFIAMLLGGLVGFFLQHVMRIPWRSSMSAADEYAILALFPGLALGALGCIYQMVTTLLPRLQ